MSFGGGSGSSSIAGSTDVVLSSPANNQVLGYNTSLSKWQNQAQASSPYFNVTSYGAVGNGSTNDSAAFTACLAAARATNGTVYLAPGKTYVIAGVFDPTGTTISGYGATVRVMAGTTMSGGGLFQGSSFDVMGLTIDLNKANTTNPANIGAGMAIYIQNTAGWTRPAIIRDVTVKNGYQVGISLSTINVTTNPVNAPASPALIENTVVSGCQWGIMTFCNSDVTVSGCTISGMTQEGVYDFLSRRSAIIGNAVSGCGSHGVVSAYGRDTRIVGNSATGCTGGSGLCIGGGEVTFAASVYWTIADNTCLNNGGGVWAGITVDPTLTGALETPVLSYGSITGNVCSGNQTGIVMTMGKHVAITGNDCSSNTAYGITVNSSNNTVSGNSCSGNNYGIAFFGVNGNHTVGVNGVDGNTTKDYIFDATVPATPVPYRGNGVPAFTAPRGSTYTRLDGGAGTTTYVKETVFADTTWTAK